MKLPLHSLPHDVHAQLLARLEPHDIMSIQRSSKTMMKAVTDSIEYSPLLKEGWGTKNISLLKAAQKLSLETLDQHPAKAAVEIPAEFVAQLEAQRHGVRLERSNLFAQKDAHEASVSAAAQPKRKHPRMSKMLKKIKAKLRATSANTQTAIDPTLARINSQIQASYADLFHLNHQLHGTDIPKSLAVLGAQTTHTTTLQFAMTHQHANDESLAAIAANPHATQSILHDLSRDPRAANTTLLKLVKRIDASPELLGNVLKHEKTRRAQLIELTLHPNASLTVLEATMEHPHAYEEILMNIAMHKNAIIQTLATLIKHKQSTGNVALLALRHPLIENDSAAIPSLHKALIEDTQYKTHLLRSLARSNETSTPQIIVFLSCQSDKLGLLMQIAQGADTSPQMQQRIGRVIDERRSALVELQAHPSANHQVQNQIASVLNPV